MIQVPIGVSARHVHLSQKHLEALFGSGYQLKVLKPLLQPQLFAAAETVSVVGAKGQLHHVRIVGPVRKNTQLELSHTDALTLGLKAPVRLSGNVAVSPGVRIIGPAGEVLLEEGAIVAARHIHVHREDAANWGIQDKQQLMVRVDGERGLIFNHVVARVSDKYTLELHIDTDEANAAGVKTGDFATILLD